MSFSISPGVTVSEYDLTTTIPALPASIGGFAGDFSWGPVNEVVTVSNEVQLVNKFGRPASANNANTSGVDFFCAANFLAYSNNLKVIRVGGTNIKSAVSNANSTSGVTNAANSTLYYSNYENNSNNALNATTGPFIAKYPGELGNSIKVAICDANTNAGASWTQWGGNVNGQPSSNISTLFNSRPGTSVWVSNKGGSNDEIHIAVIDKDGKFTGVANTVIEKFEYLSRATDAKNVDGSSNYYKDVINKKSQYIYWASEPIDGFSGNSSINYFSSATGLVGSSNTFYTFAGGSSGVPSQGDYQASYGKFSNSEEIEVGLIITGNANSTTINYVIDLISNDTIDPNGDISGRKDCIAFISPPLANVLNAYGSEATNVINFRNSITNSSYAVMDSGWKYQYDKYNDRYLWVPLNADIAGLCAKTDADRDPWFSPGGFNRGYIKNIVKLAWNPGKADRDTIYGRQINPVVTFPGQGTVLFGDKTMQNRPSAFDRINVRRLFIYLEKAISVAARYSLFEFNDSFTRAQFVNLVEPYLRDVQGKRGITDFRVVCDETNNTPEIIDRNEFIGDIYIKPARSINYIQLNFVATRTGVSFDEIVGQF